jgi:cell division protein FtsW
MKKALRIDKPLALLIAVLICGGIMIFLSAAFGLLARGGTHIPSVVFNHLALGVGVGLVGLIVGLAVDYKTWRRYALYIYGLGLIATAAVFIPGIGFEHAGSTSWLVVFGKSFQPAEALKLTTIIFAAAYFASIKHKAAELVPGLGGFAAIMALPAIILLLQPDIGTLGILTITIAAIYFAAGASWRDLAIALVAALMAFGVLAVAKPHIMDRVVTFINPSYEQEGQGYQIRQSLIAIGSGGFTGRGFGQGVQKFTYLPEPMGDSIFAVAGEELGFIGAVIIVALFAGLAVRGFTVATRAGDPFGALMAVGISTYFSAEALINIAMMLGLAPLTGIPLTFMSQGGSAMLVSLASAGVLLNISRHKGKGRSVGVR